MVGPRVKPYFRFVEQDLLLFSHNERYVLTTQINGEGRAQELESYMNDLPLEFEL